MTEHPAPAEPGAAMDVYVLRALYGVKRVYEMEGRPWSEGAPYPYYIPSGKPWRTHRIDAQPVPRFSTSIAAAWTIVERLGDLGACCVSVDREQIAGHVMVDVKVVWTGPNVGDHGNTFRAAAETAPLAICVGALKAVSARPPSATQEPGS